MLVTYVYVANYILWVKTSSCSMKSNPEVGHTSAQHLLWGFDAEALLQGWAINFVKSQIPT